MRFHWQNLSRDRGGRVPFDGRAWLQIFGRTLAWQWVLDPRIRAAISVGLDKENGREFHFRFLFFSFFISLTFAGSWKLPNRELSLNVHDNALWWHVWSDPDCWDSRLPRWKQGAFFFDDFLFGKSKHWSENERVVQVMLPLPEKSYPGKVTMSTAVWKRPRWFTFKRPSAYVEIARNVDPPGFPGKGESDWDCGDDAIYGLSTNATTVPEAVGKYVTAVLRNREARGVSLDYVAAL